MRHFGGCTAGRVADPDIVLVRNQIMFDPPGRIGNMQSGRIPVKSLAQGSHAVHVTACSVLGLTMA